MYDIASEVVSIADACLGGLQGRAALLIGPNEQRYPYIQLLWRARMKNIIQEDKPVSIPYLLPHVQLVINMPAHSASGSVASPETVLTAAAIAQGCEGRHTPLLIFDLAPHGSVEELAGLLPAVCLYTPEDLRHIFRKIAMKAS